MPYTANGRISRRILVKTAMGLTTILTAPTAYAAQPVTVLKLPCSVAYMRFSKTGVETIAQKDRGVWEQMARRLGGLVDRFEPFSFSNVLPVAAPITDGGASAALQARMTASRAGYDYILLYAVIHPASPEPMADQDVTGTTVNRRRHHRARWLFRSIKKNKLRFSDPPPESFILGEAHLIEALSGNVVASTWASAPPNRAVGILRKKRDPEAEIMTGLVQDMERRIQSLAKANYHAKRSIAG